MRETEDENIQPKVGITAENRSKNRKEEHQITNFAFELIPSKHLFKTRKARVSLISNTSRKDAREKTRTRVPRKALLRD